MVKYLEYKKDKLPVRLSYRALKSLKGKDLAKLASGGDSGTILDDEMFEELLWAGLRSGHSHEEKELKLKKEDMEDVLDECFFEFVQMIPQFFGKEKNAPEVEKKGNEEPNLPQSEEGLVAGPTTGTTL
jgi:hypothetical protein